MTLCDRELAQQPCAPVISEFVRRLSLTKGSPSKYRTINVSSQCEFFEEGSPIRLRTSAAIASAASEAMRCKFWPTIVTTSSGVSHFHKPLDPMTTHTSSGFNRILRTCGLKLALSPPTQTPEASR